MSSKPISILLAEDDPDDRYLFKRALTEIPISTSLTIINDGELLMNYLSANSNNLPDVLFLDLSMPRKTGFECLYEIKENEKLKDIVVIVFTTSYTQGIDLERNLTTTLINIGAEQYIRKPNDFDQHKEIIHKTLISITGKAKSV